MAEKRGEPWTKADVDNLNNMAKKSPELRATLDLIMLYMKQMQGEITTLKKQGYISEKHEETLVNALHNVGDMVANCVEYEVTTKALKELRGEGIKKVMKNAHGYMGKGEKHD